MSSPAPSAAPIAAIATPPGRGGVGIVRVSGHDLGALIEGIAGRALRPRVATRVTFRGARGEPLDDGLALYFPQPHSYTGDDVVECRARERTERRVGRFDEQCRKGARRVAFDAWLRWCGVQ